MVKLRIRWTENAKNEFGKMLTYYDARNGNDKYSRFIVKMVRESLRLEAISHEQVIREEQLSIMFTTTAALLGLNKESIERTSKISEYKNLMKSKKISNSELSLVSMVFGMLLKK